MGTDKESLRKKLEEKTMEEIQRYSSEKLAAPVHKGQVLELVPSGIAKDDPFVNYHGFIIFLKGVPQYKQNSRVRVIVTAVKERYAFAEYDDQED